MVEGDELVGGVAYEVLAAHAAEGFADERPVLGIVVAEEGFVEAAGFGRTRDGDVLAGGATQGAQWVAAGVVHRGRGGHR